jgi:signal transduction histidine kinase/DNA-binding response OmpR family regulator
MLEFFKKIYLKIINYNSSKRELNKLELRQFRALNMAIFIVPPILIIVSYSYFITKQYFTTIYLSLFSIAFLVLFLSKIESIAIKATLHFYLILVCVFIMTRIPSFGINANQYLGLLLLGVPFFFNNLRFYLYLLLVVTLYYFNFFTLKQNSDNSSIFLIPFIFISIIVRKFMEDVERYEIKIDETNKKLSQLDLQKSRLFSNISHEIRTPLTLILGANEHLQGFTETQKYTQIIKSNSDRLLELVSQILELSKLENNQREVELTEIDFGLFIRDYIHSFESLAGIKKRNFQYEQASNLVLVFIDQDAVSKIVTNLLGNAFKFSREGDSISIQAQLNTNDFLQLIISDTGKGISKKELPHIFDQYYHSNVGLEASSGIGLALVKELVNSLGGTISVESKVDNGSVFTVDLPCVLEQFEDLKIKYAIKNNQKGFVFNNNLFLESETEDVEESKSEAFDTGEKEILLLVEDNSVLRAFIKEIVSKEYLVIEAKDGEEGIEKAIEIIPDIIISDIMMPKIDGLQLLKTLKNDIRTSHIPIVLLTARADETDVFNGLELEADDYMAKPFRKKELLLRLKNRLSTRDKLRKKYENFTQLSSKDTPIVTIEDQFLEKINTKVENHLSDIDFGSDELALEIGLSKSQLFRKIKAVTNLSTSIYMRNVRLEQAKIRLQQKQLTVSEIAYETGFSSPSYFSKSFKEYTGFTAKEFLENLK